jgi:hypothetical protein
MDLSKSNFLYGENRINHYLTTKRRQHFCSQYEELTVNDLMQKSKIAARCRCALVRKETLILTNEVLQKVNNLDENVLTTNTANLLPYFMEGHIEWTEDYPQRFRDLISIDDSSDLTRTQLQITPLGYGYFPRDTTVSAKVYFAATERKKYDFQNIDTNGMCRGVLLSVRDPLGHDTSITFDKFGLLPIQVINPA